MARCGACGASRICRSRTVEIVQIGPRKWPRIGAISTVDPDTRHVHKTVTRRQDGFQAHLAVEPDTGIITDCALTKANGADNREAADPAYLSGVSIEKHRRQRNTSSDCMRSTTLRSGLTARPCCYADARRGITGAWPWSRSMSFRA